MKFSHPQLLIISLVALVMVFWLHQPMTGITHDELRKNIIGKTCELSAGATIVVERQYGIVWKELKKVNLQITKIEQNGDILYDDPANGEFQKKLLFGGVPLFYGDVGMSATTDEINNFKEFWHKIQTKKAKIKDECNFNYTQFASYMVR